MPCRCLNLYKTTGQAAGVASMLSLAVSTCVAPRTASAPTAGMAAAPDSASELLGAELSGHLGDLV
jgi:hypothetical protein